MQPAQRRPRFIGDISFGELTQNPYAATAFSKIQSQLAKEGANTSDVQAAQTSFTNSYNQLASVASGLGGEDVIDAAQSYVMAGNTILGAATTIGGLISAAGSMPPQAVIQAFTGTLIGVAIAAGTVSAGVGAAVVAGVDALIQILGQVGLFGPTPGGTQVCPGYYCQGAAFTVETQASSGQVGCCCVFPNVNSSAQVSPASPNWRNFPSPSSATDAAWFTPTASGVLSWSGAEFGVPAAVAGSGAMPQRPIDHAFPQYRTLECNIFQATGTLLEGFYNAFFSAWKANAAYALNGLKAQDDAQVLLHTIRLWNRAHAASTTAALAPNDTAVLVPPGGLCGLTDPLAPIYATMLVNAAVNDVGSSDINLVDSSGNLIVNMGALYGGLQVLKPVGPSGTIRMNPTLPALFGTSAGMSTGKKIAIGAGSVLVGAAGIGTYALATQQSVGFLADTLADRVSSVVTGAGEAVRTRFPRKRMR